MSSCENHLIELSFIKNDEIFSNQINILRGGLIRNYCSQSVLTITLNNLSNSVEVKKGKFKFLLKLKSGKNEIKLAYCNSTKNFNVYYEPNQNVYKVSPLWIINLGHDGTFQTTEDDPDNSPEIACQKVNLALQLIQCVISEKFAEIGLTRKQFHLEDCVIFNSDLHIDSARSLNDQNLYDSLAKEILEKRGKDSYKHTKYVGFLSCTHYSGVTDGDFSYRSMNKKLQANPRLGGGFFCLLGSACLFSWPTSIENVMQAFTNTRKIDQRRLMDDSNYRSTFAGCFATTLGSLCHELCHTFDLGHTVNGIMGKHFDYIDRFFLTTHSMERLPERRLCHQPNEEVPRKLTKLQKPGQTLLENYHMQRNTDMTFFERNCYTILYHHKWFNNHTITSEIHFDEETRVVVSSADSFLKLIETRNASNSLVTKYWTFDPSVKEFKIPDNIILRDVILFVINDCGDILKKQF